MLTPTLLFAAACTVLGPASPRADLLARVLEAAPSCPRDVHELTALLEDDGVDLAATLVANRGHHNPGRGSFSVFEVATGFSRTLDRPVTAADLQLGHFTAPASASTLTLDQAPRRGALMIELIAWDDGKDVYNFYELIGDGERGQWFYRGDSRDVQADIAALHLGTPSFGGRLRCSGCHLSGGPIMKELAPPHSDWWRVDRPLPLGGRRPDAGLASVFERLVDADVLASAVVDGAARLAAGAASREGSPQERLRPLFCPLEVNFAADEALLDGPSSSTRLAAAVLVSPLLSGAQAAVAIPKDRYLDALASLGARFPETSRRDGAHAWLAPIKAAWDERAIATLLADGMIDEELLADVLAVDLTNPAFSATRCSLLALVPKDGTALTWREDFLASLAEAARDRGTLAIAARELLRNVEDPRATQAAHAARSRAILDACRERSSEPGAARDLLRLVAQRRAEIAASAISSNPRGQILEPGFRVIFPSVTPSPRPGALTLDDACRVVER